MRKNEALSSMLNFEFKEIGKLRLDRVLFESYHPILFTCLNEKNELFLCVCCQADKERKKWLITTVRPSTVVDMLLNRITIRDAFLIDNGKKYSIIYRYDHCEYALEDNNLVDWDIEKSIYLPTAGEYMDTEDDEFSQEISYFTDMMIQSISSLEMKENIHKKITLSIQDMTKYQIPDEFNSKTYTR